ncbi:MAG: tetraacyldisaccharide 4'-kinase [Alphaproteobacteria bacterium]|nr:tetraacyldisaccharide 4'-kinase [Alphaproteobacteria bacterium]
MRAPSFWGPPANRFSLAATALAPAAWAYAAAHRLRWAVTTPRKAPVPVVCIGNLVAGGAGKTPAALAIAARLRGRGALPHFLTRGHGGTAAGPLRVDPLHHGAATVGDEALLLAAAAPTWVARDRLAGADRAAAAGASVVVLDDGFQNPGIAKDVSFVVVDAAYGFGNGRTLPAGPLRESAAFGLERANAIVVIGGDCALPGAKGPILRARLEATEESRRRLAGARVLAFAGMGRPSKFFATLAALGCNVVSSRAVADHHPYRPVELARLRAEAAAAGARLVTTAKDLARIEDRAGIEFLEVALAFDDEEALDRVLAPALHQ